MKLFALGLLCAVLAGIAYWLIRDVSSWWKSEGRDQWKREMGKRPPNETH